MEAARVGSSHPRGAAVVRRSGRSRAPETGSGAGEGERGGVPRPRRSGRARRAPGRAHRRARGKDSGGTGSGPPGAGGSAFPTTPAGATPPGTAAAPPRRRTRGDTVWRVSRVNSNALCTGLGDGRAITERDARIIDRTPGTHARWTGNLADLALLESVVR